jgi:hypothetical protein
MIARTHASVRAGREAAAYLDRALTQVSWTGKEDVMSHRLPWWLFVILGWAVVFILALQYLYSNFLFGFAAAQAPGTIDYSALSLTRQLGAYVTLVVSIAIASLTYLVVRTHGQGCAFTIAIPLLLLVPVLLLVLLWLANPYFYPLQVLLRDWNPFVVLYQLLHRFIS